MRQRFNLFAALPSCLHLAASSKQQPTTDAGEKGRMKAATCDTDSSFRLHWQCCKTITAVTDEFA
jgi:hypothetical protein